MRVNSPLQHHAVRLRGHHPCAARGPVRQAYTQLYVHLVWATWNRMPLVTEQFRQAIYGWIQDQGRKHRCEVLAIGGIEDHVHLLIRFPTTARISEVVQHMKGREISIAVDLGLGKGVSTAWTCDLTHGYIDINGSYRS